MPEDSYDGHSTDPTAAVRAELSSLRVQIQAIEKNLEKLAQYPTDVDKAVAAAKAQLDEKIAAIEARVEGNKDLVPLFHNSLTAIEVTRKDVELLRGEINERNKANKEALSLALASIDKATVIAQQTADRAVAKAEAAASQTLLESMIAAIRDNFGGQIANQKEMLWQAMSAAKEAVAKAEAANEKRFEGLNELRGVMSDQVLRFMPRTEAEAMYRANAEKTDAMASRMDKTEGHSSGVASTGTVVAGSVAVVGTIIMTGIAILALTN